MLPAFVIDNFPYDLVTDSEVPSYVSLGKSGSVKASHFENFLFCEESSSMLLALYRGARSTEFSFVAPTFRFPVLGVLKVRAKEEMIGVNTIPDIASMAHDVPLGVLSLSQKVGDPMGVNAVSREVEPSISSSYLSYRRANGISGCDGNSEEERIMHSQRSWKYVILFSALCQLFLSSISYSRERAFGYCEQGNHVVITQGLSSDTKVQQSFPSCTVAVYNEGTTTLSNIYADNSGTVKGNPFTSDANGYWFFYANNGRYDVHFYDSDITVPYTQGDYLLCDPADATGAFSCTGGGAGSCLPGSLYTQYVDSGQGIDTNNGTNWCVSKLTETAGSTGLSGLGGTIREAPNYTGAAATGVPANVNIFRYNQFDTLGSSMQLFAFPDLDTSSENHYAFAANSNSTMADADAAFTAVNAFSAGHLITSVLGNLTIPSTSPFRTREQAGVTGIVTDNSATDVYQADGVLGMCYNSGSLGLDCTGVVGIAGNGTTGQSGSMEAMWANLSLGAPTTDAMGLVIRATGGHMPTTQIGSVSGRPNSAIDIAYGGSGAAADAFPTGIFFENQAAGLTNFAFTGNGTLNQPHTDVFTYDRWWDYYSASTPLDTFSVIKLNNNAITDQGTYQPGNYIYQNSVNSSEVVLPINHTGTVKVEGVNGVSFSATPTFDRALGSVQTITLTGDVTSSTLQNCVAGQTFIFDIIEDVGGGHTFSAPANVHGFTAITTTGNFHNTQMFYCTGGSSNSEAYAVPYAGT